MDLNLDVNYVKQLKVKDIIDSIIVGSHKKKYTASMMDKNGDEIKWWAEAEAKVEADQMSGEELKKWKEDMATKAAAENTKQEKERLISEEWSNKVYGSTG